MSGSERSRLQMPAFRPAAKIPGKTFDRRNAAIHFGHITRNGENIDEVLLSIMPRAANIHSRGCRRRSPAMAVCFWQNWSWTPCCTTARAQPNGRVYRRAFLNGRIDLAQAEAVAD